MLHGSNLFLCKDYTNDPKKDPILILKMSHQFIWSIFSEKSSVPHQADSRSLSGLLDVVSRDQDRRLLNAGGQAHQVLPDAK